MKYTLCILLASIACIANAQDSTEFWKSRYLSASSHYRFTDAIQNAGHWVRHDSLNPEAWYELARTCAQKGARPCTQTALSELFAIDSTHISGLNLLAKAQLAANENEAATATFERLMAIDSTNPYYTRKAALLWAQQDHGYWKAYTYFQKSLALDSTDVDTYVDFAKYDIERKALYPADLLLEKALEIDSTHQEARLTAARSAQLQGDPEDVIRLLKNRTFDLGYIAVAARYYGAAQYKTGDYRGAIASFELIATIDVEADYPHYYAGLCHGALGENAEALAHFNTAIEKATSPNLTTYYQVMGETYQETGDHKAAIVQLRQAEFLSSEKDLLYLLGISYEAHYADKSMALKAFQEYLAQDATGGARSIYAKQRIEEIKKEAHFKPGN